MQKTEYYSSMVETFLFHTYSYVFLFYGNIYAQHKHDFLVSTENYFQHFQGIEIQHLLLSHRRLFSQVTILIRCIYSENGKIVYSPKDVHYN